MLKTNLFIITIILGLMLVSCGIKNNATTVESSVKSTDKNTRQAVTPSGNGETQCCCSQSPYAILGNSKKYSEKQFETVLKWRESIVALADKNPDRMFINAKTDKKQVAITFDDGPDSKITPKILDTLNKYQVKGNFFFLGTRIASNASIVKRAYDEGNLVLSHGWNHNQISKEKPDEIIKDITSTEDEIFKIINKKPAMIRPPYGDVDKIAIDELHKLGLSTIIWSIDTLDWFHKDEENITRNVIDNVRSGDIILMHCNEDKIKTAEALPSIIHKLDVKGYKIVDLHELLNIPAYK